MTPTCVPSFGPALRRLATVALFLSLGGPAHAAGCADPTANVGCSLAECLALQADVNATKAGLSSCNSITGCSLLRSMKSRWLAHYEARSRINTRCYAGGDLGHQQAAAQAIQNVSNCDARIALPEPVGCADPCP